jgi:hypothetical protein
MQGLSHYLVVSGYDMEKETILTTIIMNSMKKEIYGIIGLNFQVKKSGIGRIRSFRQKL